MRKGDWYRIEHRGEFLNLRQLAERVGVPYSTVIRRHAKGERGDRLTRPPEEKYRPRGNWG